MIPFLVPSISSAGTVCPPQPGRAAWLDGMVRGPEVFL
jgi:hypothetical protein